MEKTLGAYLSDKSASALPTVLDIVDSSDDRRNQETSFIQTIEELACKLDLL